MLACDEEPARLMQDKALILVRDKVRSTWAGTVLAVLRDAIAEHAQHSTKRHMFASDMFREGAAWGDGRCAGAMGDGHGRDRALVELLLQRRSAFCNRRSARSPRAS
jgi:hypothetical protein